MGCASPTAGTNGLEIVTPSTEDDQQHQPNYLQPQKLTQQSLQQQQQGASGPRSSSKGDLRVRRGFHSDYILGGKLGKGAFAQVYTVRKAAGQGEDSSAVKVMDLRADRSGKPRSESEPIDTKRKAAVETEIAILAKVAGLGYSVCMHDSYLDGAFSYIVMEKCDKTLLLTLECQPVLIEYTVKKIFQEMLEGLKQIHSLGVVHRDIKPDNFLCVGADSTVKLCDFGLASIIKEGGQLSGVYGTPPFMSPEMLSTQGHSELTDVWSVGVIAYVLLLGQFPYKPAEPSGKAMKAAIKAGVPEPTFKAKPRLETGSGPGVSQDGRQFLIKLLARDPKLRPDARCAQQIRWLHDKGTPEERAQMTSLRPMLYAARRAGAFDPPRNDKEVDKSGLDSLMQDLQAKHQKVCLSPHKASKASKATPSYASTEVSSMSASDRSGQSSLDFQAPGYVAGPPHIQV